jgi:hypothetical protein
MGAAQHAGNCPLTDPAGTATIVVDADFEG